MRVVVLELLVRGLFALVPVTKSREAVVLTLMMRGIAQGIALEILSRSELFSFA